MTFVVSLLFGVVVGVAYALVGLKSPAPPIVALGIVIGEQGVIWLKQAPLRTVAQHDTAQPKGGVKAPPDALTER